MKKLFLFLAMTVMTSFIYAQDAATKTYVIETFNNSCLVDVGGGIIDARCTEDDYPYTDSSNSNVRYKVEPDGNKTAWGVFQVAADGTKTKINSFFLNTNQASPANSYVDVETGEIYLHTSEGYTVYNPSENSLSLNSQDGFVSTSNGVIFRDVNISDLIREESDGTIHIGENSLVTVEQDGKQQLYATDANGDQIDINIKKGTDLLVDGKSVTQALKDIDTNKTNISKNADDIATNKTNISKNADDIATNKTNISKNADDIATNKTNIATNATNIVTNATNIATNKTNIETNALGIANNSLRIDNLAALVNSNVNRIEGLETLTGLMRNEYRTGIASSIALSQIQYASDGFSIGVGHGEFKDKNEMAVGIGYGGQFNEKVDYQFQFGSSDDSTGFGFTIRF